MIETTRISARLCAAALCAGLGVVLALDAPAAFAQTQPPGAAKPARPAKPPAKSRQVGVKPGTAPAETDAGKFGTGKPNPFDTEAPVAYLTDFETGTVLYEKNIDQRIGPASMSKMITIYLAFEKLKLGALRMDDQIAVSDKTWKAWNNRGSTMFIPWGGRVKVEDLLRGIIVQSGNDACVVLAEGLFGSEEVFADEANRKAQELGLTGSHFVNSTGWPDPNHFMTARDLATLGRRLIADFPEYYPLFKEKDFTYNNTRQGNRNPLLYRESGVDGIKTGHTEDAGYGLTISAERNGRRLLMVVHGLKNMRHRANEAERLLDWGFREFNNYAVVKAGDKVADAAVWYGEVPKVPLAVGEDVLVTLPRAARRDLKVRFEYNEPIPAPVAKGAEVGKLVVTATGIEPVEVPLVAAADVDKVGLIARMGANLSHLLFGAKAR